MSEIKEADYYSLHRILTLNSAWNFIIGARGLGKTFDAKRHCVRDFIKNGHQFIYLRRSWEDIKKSKDSFFADIEPFFKGFTFRVNGNLAQILRDGGDDKKGWKTCGFFAALSQAGGVKSVPYPNVYWIIYDEVFPDNLMFLRNEVTQFEEFYNTVDRWSDRTRVLFLSNAVIQANPYFSKFKIDTSKQQSDGEQFGRYCGGFICIEFADYGGFSAKVSQSRFGKFLLAHDSDYAEYAIDNRFLDDSPELINRIPSNAHYGYTLDTETYGSFGVWIGYNSDFTKRTYYISRTIKANAEKHFTLDYRGVTPNIVYVKKTDNIIRNLTDGYRTGKLRFDNKQSKADFSMVIGQIIGK